MNGTDDSRELESVYYGGARARADQEEGAGEVVDDTDVSGQGQVARGYLAPVA